jgi:hypothetical protein
VDMDWKWIWTAFILLRTGTSIEPSKRDNADSRHEALPNKSQQTLNSVNDTNWLCCHPAVFPLFLALVRQKWHCCSHSVSLEERRLWPLFRFM